MPSDTVKQGWPPFDPEKPYSINGYKSFQWYEQNGRSYWPNGNPANLDEMYSEGDKKP